MKVLALVCVALLAACALAWADAPASVSGSISPAVKDDNGFLVHAVESPFQAGRTQIKVLVPDDLAEGWRYSVVYVLPVERQGEQRYGDGLVEIQRQGLANKHGLIFVAPTFSHLPWYADHPTEKTIRQESYFVQVVVPFVDKQYPTAAESSGRLLLGFSKSGWGAWSLLLRNPNVFGRAAAWDAPLMMEREGLYGSGEIFATRENFQNHQVSQLVRKRAELLMQEPRLILTGFGGFRQEHQQMHAMLDERKIPHAYRDGPERKHDWHSGWVPEAVELLVQAVEK